MNILQIQDLSVDYGDGPVLDSLSIDFEVGRIHGLVGRNGEGKTTLLNAVAGRIRPTKGKMVWGSVPEQDRVAYLETELFFYPMITGDEYLQIFSTREPTFKQDQWNEVFELPLGEYVSNYSTGMKKKLALLSIFALDRPLVMLDEPFNGLDLETNVLLSRILEMMAAEGKTVFVTSHILESLSPLCDEIHWLREGRIARSFTRENAVLLRDEILHDLDEAKLPRIRQLMTDMRKKGQSGRLD